jgi:hypothetical protein
MSIGDAWNIDDPTKPWMLWDPDANIVIPIGIDDWLADLATTYSDHEVITADPLTCVSKGAYTSGQRIPIRMDLVASPTFTPGKKYPFTLRIKGTDGQTQDDRTFWLKIKDR